ncbi:MAG: pitrilysin family protein [Pseudomonadota bacterium]
MFSFIPTVRYALLALGLVFYLAAGPAQSQSQDPPQTPTQTPTQSPLDFVHEQLANGLSVFVIPNQAFPLVHHSIWYRVGSVDETSGKTGLAHLAEHMMFMGTTAFPKGELDRFVRASGGQHNAGTSNDYTVYHQTGAPQDLSTLMAIEADRMMNQGVDPVALESERDVVLDERRRRMDLDPYHEVRIALQRALFGTHPYAREVIGSREDIIAITASDVRDWFDRWYNPGGAVVVIAGQVEPAQALELARRHYGALPAHTPTRADHRVLPDLTQQDVHMSLPGSAPPVWLRTYRADRTLDVSPAVLTVLGRALLAPTSAPVRTLVYETGQAGYLGASYNLRTFAHQLSISSEVRRKDDLQDVIDRVDAHLEKVRAGAVGPDVLAGVKKTLRVWLETQRDSVIGPANLLGEAIIQGLSPSQIRTFAQDVDAVTAQDLARAARLLLREDHQVDLFLSFTDGPE